MGDRDRRDDRDDRGRRDDRGDRKETDTKWVLAGVGWPFQNGKEGFNIDVDWPLKQGARLQLSPRRDAGNNEPWNLYELREKPKSQGGGNDRR